MVEVDIPQLIGLLEYVGVSVASALAVYFLAKRKIHEFRIAVDDVDDALKDDKVSEEEFLRIFEDFKALVKGEPAPEIPPDSVPA